MRALLISLVLLCGCGTPGYIRADAIDGTVKRIRQRHDFYVKADSELAPLERRANLRDTELLETALNEAKKAEDGDDNEE